VNVCVVTPNFPPMPWPCGLADFVDRLATNLHSAGVGVSVLTSHPAADARRSYPVQVIPGNWGYFHQRRLARWIAGGKFDAVDLQYESFAFGRRSRALWFPLRLRRPRPARVLTLHSQGVPRWGGRVWRVLQMRPWEAVVFYSEPFLARMAVRFPSRVGRFHHLGFPSNIPIAVAPALAPLVGRVKAGWADPRALVIYFGHISPGRGIEDLLAAAKLLAARGLAPQFVLVSKFDPTTDDYHLSLLARVRADGLTEQVSFPGQLPAEQVSHLFQAADAVALPFPEGASFKNGTLAAALAHGAAVVTTVTDLTESALKTDGVLAAYRPGDVAALADRLAEVLTDPARRAALGAAARRVGESLGWDEYVRRRVEIYAAALKEAGR
jgi:glycosyltransferase involved in cell wall biosynthesis